jgi:hypothetical protein
MKYFDKILVILFSERRTVDTLFMQYFTQLKLPDNC